MNRREFEEIVSDLDAELSQIKSLFDQWVQGIERVAPVRRKDRVERRLRQLRRDVPNQTALRFRFQSLWARWTSLNTLWMRTLRQMEDGTHRRDVLRRRRNEVKLEEARQARKEAREAEGLPEPIGLPEPLTLDLGDTFDSQKEIEAALAELAAPSHGRSVGSSSVAPALSPPLSPSTPPTPPVPGSRARSSRGAPPPVPPGARSVPPVPPGARSVPPVPPGARSVPPVPPGARSIPPVPPGARSVPPVPPGARSVPPVPPGARSVPPVARSTRPRPSPGRGATSSGASASTSSGLSDRDVAQIYDRYVAARKKNNQSADMSLEKMKARLRKMEPGLREKHKGAVDFKVVVKDGRVGLKAVKKE